MISKKVEKTLIHTRINIVHYLCIENNREILLFDLIILLLLLILLDNIFHEIIFYNAFVTMK